MGNAFSGTKRGANSSRSKCLMPACSTGWWQQLIVFRLIDSLIDSRMNLLDTACYVAFSFVADP